MRLQNRVEKLEWATGINVPCEVCEAISRSEARTLELEARLGIIEPKVPPVPFQTNCGWCLRPVTVDLCDFNLGERVLYERMRAVYPAGTLCLPENKALWDELTAAFDRIAREKYGDHYDQYREVQNVYLNELAEISTRRAPRTIYLCRVPGCSCSHPKTEGEWHRRVQTRGIAA